MTKDRNSQELRVPVRFHLPVGLVVVALVATLLGAVVDKPDSEAQSATFVLDAVSLGPGYLARTPATSPGAVHIRGDGVDEQVWGPQALSIDEAGTHWILDAAGGRLVRIDAQGKTLDPIAFPPEVPAALDVLVVDGRVFLLDVMSTAQAVVEINKEGKLVERFRLPRSATVFDGMPAAVATGLLASISGQLVVELASGSSFLRLDLRTGSFTEQPRYEINGVTFEKIEREGSAEPLLNGSRVGHFASTDDTYQSVRLIEVGRDGTALIEIEQAWVDDRGIINVEQTLEVYDQGSTQPRHRFRVEIDLSAAHVANPAALDSNGDVRILRAHPDQVMVSDVRMVGSSVNETEQVRLIAATKPLDSPAVRRAPRQIWECDMVRQGYNNTSAGYLWTQRNYNSTAVNGSCSSVQQGATYFRKKPGPLTVGGPHLGVWYQWGGYDTVASYNSALNAGTKRAGDINQSPWVKPCAAGVDCSGYTARVWGINIANKPGSQTFGSTYGQPIGSSGLRQYDVITRPGHVLFFFQHENGNYFWTNESTTLGFDKTIVRQAPWSYVAGRPAHRSNILAALGC